MSPRYAILALALLGCSGPSDNLADTASVKAPADAGWPRGLSYRVHVDPVSLGWEAAATSSAVASWLAAVPALSLDVDTLACDGSLGSGDICVHPATAAQINVLGLVDKAGSTIPSLDGGNVLVDQALTPDLYQRLAEHELGHCMAGRDHLPEGNLMAADVDSPVLTAADIAHFWAVRSGQ